MNAKKKMLVAWGNPFIFNEAVLPLIDKLANNFELTVLLEDFYMPENLTNILKHKQAQGVIADCIVIPNHNKLLNFHVAMQVAVKKLKPQNFDVLLAGSLMTVFDRYLTDLVMPAKSLKVCFWHGLTYLLEKEALQTQNVESSKPRKITLFKGIRYLLTRMYLVFRKFKDFSDRFLLPLMLAGKTFPLKKYDVLTQIGTEGISALIFCDELEALAHAKLLGNVKTLTGKYPIINTCRCNGTGKPKTIILSPLSGFVGSDSIPDKYLSLYLRDFKAVLNNTGASKVHLRKHPRETGRWPNQLKDYLAQNGVDARVVEATKPLREIMCNYAAMAGFASCALRDARYFCHDLLVIGFVAVSKGRYRDPKSVFGMGEGIGWIEEDGSFSDETFKKERFVPKERSSVDEILMKLVKNA